MKTAAWSQKDIFDKLGAGYRQGSFFAVKVG
jgi:hypothetical protein